MIYWLEDFLSDDASFETIQSLQVSFIVETAMFVLDELFASFSLVSTDIMRQEKKKKPTFDIVSALGFFL